MYNKDGTVHWPIPVRPTKYLRWYDNIISQARKRTLPDNVYSERHHVIPASFGGSNAPENLVELTAREHFIVHALLWKMRFPEPYHAKMVAAFRMMLMATGSRAASIKTNINSSTYAKLREEFSQTHSERMRGQANPFYGKKHSQEIIDKILETKNQTGNHGQRFKPGHVLSPDVKAKISAKLKGRKWKEHFDEETYKRLRGAASERAKKKNTGAVFSEDRKRKISEARKNYYANLSDEKRAEISLRASEKSKGHLGAINEITYRGTKYRNFGEASRAVGKSKWQIRYEIERWGSNPDEETIRHIDSNEWKVPWNKGSSLK